MGSIIYKVEDQRMPGSLWAMKELLIEQVTYDPEEWRRAVECFAQTSAMMIQLTRPASPRLSRVINRFSASGGYYVMMEYVPGKSLEQVLDQARQALPERQAVEWAIQICEALTFLHSQTPPVILGDLNPSDVMVTPSGEVKLVDLGIGRSWAPPPKPLNPKQAINLGLWTYSSPEYLGRIGQTDARSDIYSLGAILYYLLTYEEPVPLDTPPSGSLRKRNPVVSQLVENLVIKAMQLDPQKRFQSAAIMQNALYACLGSRPPALQAGLSPQVLNVPPPAQAPTPLAPVTAPTVSAQISSRALPRDPRGRLQAGAELQHGRYRVEEVLAAGGMGAVYRVADRNLKQACALKEMLERFHTEHERKQGIEWFEREAHLLLRLSHPMIPHIFDAFTEDGQYYLVMELVEGRTLAEVLEQEGQPYGLPEMRVRLWAIQLCEVLTYLHERKPHPVIFRDLKPSNIMLTHAEEIRLLSLGHIGDKTCSQYMKNRPNFPEQSGFSPKC